MSPDKREQGKGQRKDDWRWAKSVRWQITTGPNQDQDEARSTVGWISTLLFLFFSFLRIRLALDDDDDVMQRAEKERAVFEKVRKHRAEWLSETEIACIGWYPFRWFKLKQSAASGRGVMVISHVRIFFRLTMKFGCFWLEKWTFFRATFVPDKFGDLRMKKRRKKSFSGNEIDAKTVANRSEKSEILRW